MHSAFDAPLGLCRNVKMHDAGGREKKQQVVTDKRTGSANKRKKNLKIRCNFVSFAMKQLFYCGEKISHHRVSDEGHGGAVGGLGEGFGGGG